MNDEYIKIWKDAKEISERIILKADRMRDALELLWPSLDSETYDRIRMRTEEYIRSEINRAFDEKTKED